MSHKQSSNYIDSVTSTAANLAQFMIRSGLRHEARLAGASVRDIVRAETTASPSARKTHRWIMGLAMPSMFFLVVPFVLFGALLSWITFRLSAPAFATAAIGYGIIFIPAAVFLCLDAFVWLIRLRQGDITQAVLGPRGEKRMLYISIIGCVLALASAAVLFMLWPNVFPAWS
jgi:hypothetical protein